MAKPLDTSKCFWICRAFLATWILADIACLMKHTIPADCSIDKHTIKCRHSLPKWVPRTVTRVEIKGFNQDTPVPFKIDPAELEHITELDITFYRIIDPYLIDDNAFSGLKKLRVLGLHGNNFRRLGKYTFNGLDLLERLDLSGSWYLKFQQYILPSIDSVALPKLSSLNLSGIESANVNNIVINNPAIDMLIRNSIINLNLSSTNIMDKVSNYSRPLLVEHIDISNITLMSSLHPKHDIAFLFSHLKTLVANDLARYNFLGTGFINVYKNFTSCNAGLNMKIEKVYFNKISPHPMAIKNSTFDWSNCSIGLLSSIKSIHFRFNQLEELDAVVTLPENNITEIDFSHNIIKYISPMVLKDLNSLRHLNLAYNRLHHMEKTPNFDDLLKSLNVLEEISIAHNHLTVIPYDIFVNNKMLRMIDLFGNSLETVEFEIDHLTNLKYINLKDNRIKMLPENFRSSIMSLMHKQGTHGEIGSVEISLEGNDMECSCETKDFVKWMIEYFQPVEKRSFRCIIDGKLKEINRDTLKETEYLCIRTTVIISAAVSSCCVIILVTIGVVYVVHKKRLKRQRDKRQNYLEAFSDGLHFHGNVQVSYVAFLAHSGADVDVANTVIYKQLDNTFKEIIGVSRSTVCTGDKDFMPGFSIIEQTMQCLEKSCVAILIISDAFCRSQWCELELKEAYQQQKPIVLIFIERIDENLMSPILLNIFKTQVRATLHHRNGEYVLEPSWHVLCEAVVSLASMH